MSAISRSDGSGGKIQVPRATYSLRMSFWIVPRSCSRGTPCFSRDRDVDREQDRRGAVDRERRCEMRSSGISSKRQLRVGERVDRDADAADLLLDVGVIGVVADLRRQVERDGQPGAALREQEAVALVRLSSAVPKPEYCRIVHELAAVHVTVDAARERVDARLVRAVDPLERDSGGQ